MDALIIPIMKQLHSALVQINLRFEIFYKLFALPPNLFTANIQSINESHPSGVILGILDYLSAYVLPNPHILKLEMFSPPNM